jgi:hypothetical protein
VSNVIDRCLRCGTAYRHQRDDNISYCTSQCGAWARAERAKRERLMREASLRDGAIYPHKLHPGMLDVLERVQRLRPSHSEWEANRT